MGALHLAPPLSRTSVSRGLSHTHRNSLYTYNNIRGFLCYAVDMDGPKSMLDIICDLIDAKRMIDKTRALAVKLKRSKFKLIHGGKSSKLTYIKGHKK